MPDITRDIGQVQPNNFIRQGVQTPSPLSLASELGGMAMEVDKQHATSQLEKELDALHTQYETSAPGAQAVQEDALSPSDKAQVNSVGQQLAANKQAVDQGTMTYDQYRIRGERLLRLAISKRPGLAQDFRQVAEQHLGVDVVGASVDVLASWEHKQAAALESAAERQASAEAESMKARVKLARDQLASVGVDTAMMSDDQVMGEYPKHESAVRQFLVQQAEGQIVKTQRDTQDNSNALRSPAATAAFVGEVNKAKLDVYKAGMQLYNGIVSGQVKPGDMAAAITAAQAQLSGRISSLHNAMAAGDVNPDLAEKELAGLTELGNQMTQLVGGDKDTALLKNRLDGMKMYLQSGFMEDNPTVARLSTVTQLLGPEALASLAGPGGVLQKPVALAVGDMLNNTGDPTTNARAAGAGVSGVIATVLDRGGAATNPASVPHMAQVITNAGKSFVEMPKKDFQASDLTGPNGYITVLNSHREALTKSIPADQKDDVMRSVSMAALTNYHTLAASMYATYPSLKGKLKFDLDEGTGDFAKFKAGVTATEAEKSALRSYNQAFDGKKVLQVIQSLGGYSAMDAKNFLFNQDQAYLKASKQAAASSNSKWGANWWLHGSGQL